MCTTIYTILYSRSNTNFIFQSPLTLLTRRFTVLTPERSTKLSTLALRSHFWSSLCPFAQVCQKAPYRSYCANPHNRTWTHANPAPIRRISDGQVIIDIYLSAKSALTLIQFYPGCDITATYRACNNVLSAVITGLMTASKSKIFSIHQADWTRLSILCILGFWRSRSCKGINTTISGTIYLETVCALILLPCSIIIIAKC